MRNARSLLFVLSLAPMMTWACDKPDAEPAIPDGATAVSAQMVKAQNDVKAYVKSVQDYLACARLTPGKEKTSLDDLKALAERFNEQVRAFKAKNSG